MREERIRPGDRTFVWLETGPADGRVVVLLHGFPDGPESWTEVAAHLAEEGWRVVAPYLRGYHPDTVVAGRSYGAAQQGEDVLALLDALEVDRAPLVGHDWGASHVYAAANLAPKRIERIVPIGIPHPRAVKPSPQALWAIRHFATFASPAGELIARRNDFAYMETLLRRWAPSWSGPARDEALAAVKARMADPQVLRHALAYYKAFTPRPPTVILRRTEVPGLVIAGSEDFGGLTDAYRDSAQHFEAPCEVLIVPGVGHWPHLEAPDQVVPRLAGFLGEG